MKKINKRNIIIYAISFLIISWIGWSYEVILQVYFQKIGFHNRGVLFGPICPIYGFGGLLLYFLLRNLKNKDIRVGKLKITPMIVFVSSFVITTIVELIGSYIMEFIWGDWMWSYSDYFLNFQGRVAFSSSLRFAIGGTVIVYFIQPVINELAKKISNKVLYGIFGVLAVLLASDIIYTFFIK